MGVIKRQGIRNAVITYTGIIIGAVNIIFVQPRLLTEEELGLTRLLYDFAYLAGLAVPLGLPNIIIRYFPYFKNRETGHHGFGGIMVLFFTVGFVASAALLLAFKPFITHQYAQKSALFADYFLFIIPFTFIVSAITVVTAYCHSLFKSTVPSFINDVIVRLGTIANTVLYFNGVLSFDQFIICFIGIYLVELLLLVAFVAIVDRISFVPDRNLLKKYPIKEMFRFGIVLCVGSFASMALRKADVVILGTQSLALVGVYTTAVFIAAFIEVPLGALERITHTKVADNFARNNLAEIEKIYADSVKYLLLAGGFLYIGMTACTRYIYQIGDLPHSFTQYISVVYIVGLGALVNVSTGANSAIMFYSANYIRGVWWLIFTLAVTIALNLALIPLFGAYGAAVASLCGAALFNLIKYLFIYNRFGFQPYNKLSLLTVCSTILCLVPAFFLPEITERPFPNLLFRGGISCGLYVLLVWRLKLAPDLAGWIKSRL
jgi:O-antigen/teichoic acid export membrane protein